MLIQVTNVIFWENPEIRGELDEWLTRRGSQDPDLWIVELDIANGERFIGIT